MVFLTNSPMPGNAARRKMVLEAIERSKRSPMTESLSETSKLTVEHLLPQGWTQAGWPLPNPSVEATEARNAFIGLIGNLTLATRQLNSSMANRSWKTKQAALGPVQHARPQQGSAGERTRWLGRTRNREAERRARQGHHASMESSSLTQKGGQPL